MKKITLLGFVCLSSLLSAQTEKQFWKPVEEKNIPVTGERVIIPHKYKVAELEADNLRTALFAAPHEDNMKLNESPSIITLPMPDGSLQRFRIVESPVMAKELSEQFPQIKTFNAKGIDDIYAFAKLDWTEFGFHGMIRSTNGDIFIDPFSRNNIVDYISYYTADFEKDPSKMIPEAGVIDERPINKEKKTGQDLVTNVQAICAGGNLRTYRLALACTGEYAVAATGLPTPSVAQTLSAITTTVNRVDGVYETEVAVKLMLIANETAVIFTDAATDPFNGNNNATTLISESQTVIGGTILSANYDIGHTFSTGGGGLANLGCVCSSSQKAKGITGSPSPVGDGYDIDYVAHEMGHQFDGNHTFAASTGSCSGNANPGTRVEPGSGITIQAYAGICGTNDLSGHSIAYFHGISYDEIVNFTTTGGGNSCPVNTVTTNNPPVVSAGSTYNIPKSTPFQLIGSATDPDGDVLTYSWEETENGVSGNWNAGTKPFFRSYIPIATGDRMFPKLSVVLSGVMTTTKGEYLPGSAQTLKFRLTARDNKMGGGGVCSATSTVTIASTGPFNVTYPNTTGISWPEGSNQTVTWNVGSTDLAPVNCPNVDIYYSLDNGVTFTLLTANTPNDGTENIVVPLTGATISICRIKVVCPTNIFFDINDKTFTITSATGIHEYSNSNSLAMQVVPNPFNNSIELNAFGLNSAEKTSVLIFDIIGNLIKTDQLPASGSLNVMYDLSSLSEGVYIIQVTNGKNRSLARVIKQ